MSDSSRVLKRSRIGWGLLLLALTIEAFLLVWVVLVTVLGALGADGSRTQNFSLVAMAVISLIWVVITLAGIVRAKASWARGSALTIHVLLFAAGTGCLQLGIGSVLLGFGLVLLSLVGFAAAILARPVVPDDEVDGLEVTGDGRNEAA